MFSVGPGSPGEGQFIGWGISWPIVKYKNILHAIDILGLIQ